MAAERSPDRSDAAAEKPNLFCPGGRAAPVLYVGGRSMAGMPASESRPDRLRPWRRHRLVVRENQRAARPLCAERSRDVELGPLAGRASAKTIGSRRRDGVAGRLGHQPGETALPDCTKLVDQSDFRARAAGGRFRVGNCGLVRRSEQPLYSIAKPTTILDVAASMHPRRGGPRFFR